MSQFILDEQLAATEVLAPLKKRLKIERLQDLRSRERILDDRVPEVLLTLNNPTFVTIDKGFWHRRLCNPNYCILYFALRDDQQELLPDLLRAVLRRPEFHTRHSRMGKVARISTRAIESWQFPTNDLHRITWKRSSRKKD